VFLLLVVRWFGRGVGGTSFLFVTLLSMKTIGQPQASECAIHHIAEFFVLAAAFLGAMCLGFSADA
jgi:hypothetical protein